MYNTPIKSINIDSIKIKVPVFLSPLAGITDKPYRQHVRQFGAGMVYSEMLSSVAMVHHSHRTEKMASVEESEYPAGIQLAGSILSIMAEAAKKAEQKGVCLIDINMGCPAKKVVNGIAGSALMRDEILAGQIIEAVVKAVNIPVTVKMRLGWDDTCYNAQSLARIAEESGAKLITVHGRTRAQFFSGKANWKAIGDVKKSVKIPVIGNGDITEVEHAKKMLEESNVDGVMIGRGTYGRPWFIKQVMCYLTTGERLADPTMEEKYKILLSHYQAILEYYGQELGVRISRKHLGWYSKGIEGASTFRALVNTEDNHYKVKEYIEKLFEGRIQE